MELFSWDGDNRFDLDQEFLFYESVNHQKRVGRKHTAAEGLGRVARARKPWYHDQPTSIVLLMTYLQLLLLHPLNQP